MKKLNSIKDISNKKYDYIIVGGGLAGITTLVRLNEYLIGKKYLVIEQSNAIGGNIRTEKIEGIHTHIFGAHIFHCNNDDVWNFVNRFAEFNDYKHRVIANTGEEHVLLPFTMTTFMQIFNVSTVCEVEEIIEIEQYKWLSKEKEFYIEKEKFEPMNFEEQAIMIVGTTIYEKLIKHYTEKQWGRKATELPAEIIKRLPLRWNTDTTYFNNAKHQGIPKEGYSSMIDNMLLSCNDSVDIMYNTSFNDIKDTIQDHINEDGSLIFTGAIDELFEYSLGQLEYRSLVFDHKVLDVENYQGTSVLNFTNNDVEQTRIIEHKWFSTEPEELSIQKTVITTEFSEEFVPGKNKPFYPIGDTKNKELHAKYVELFDKTYKNSYLCGRLAEYKYYDMDKVIEAAFEISKKIVHNTFYTEIDKNFRKLNEN